MTELNLSKLGDLGGRMDALSKKLPEEKAALMEALGKAAKGAVDSSISGAGFSDGGGKLIGWQKYSVGSRMGYVAVRPVGSKEGFASGAGSPAAITRYNEVGHSIRKHKNAASRYRPRIKVAQVAGRHFYRGAEEQAIADATRILDEYERKMEQELEGLT
ncbi:MAG: hypothetical protein RSB55_10595 [Oscillospiraceae bacterium]